MKKRSRNNENYPSLEQFAIGAEVVRMTINNGQFFFEHTPRGVRREWPEMVYLKTVLSGLRAVRDGVFAANDDAKRIRRVVKESLDELASSYSINWLIDELDELAERQQSGEVAAREEIMQFLHLFWRKLLRLRD